MKFAEIIPALLERKLVARYDWDELEHWCLSPQGFLVDQDGDTVLVSHIHLIKDDWHIVTPEEGE